MVADALSRKVMVKRTALGIPNLARLSNLVVESVLLAWIKATQLEDLE